jgi:hypothetical protein
MLIFFKFYLFCKSVLFKHAQDVMRVIYIQINAWRGRQVGGIPREGSENRTIEEQNK